MSNAAVVRTRILLIRLENETDPRSSRYYLRCILKFQFSLFCSPRFSLILLVPVQEKKAFISSLFFFCFLHENKEMTARTIMI